MTDKSQERALTKQLVAVSLGLCAIPAYAQESSQETAEGPTVTEIVVTAERRSESIQSVPMAITAVGAETIKAQNVRGIDDYFALAPNVSFASNGSRDRKELSLRGVSNQLSPYADVRASTYAFYIDDFNVVAGTSNPQIVDLERIEVLRGPQGTYFGRNAVGGAINITTKKPVNEWYSEVGLGYSTYNTRHAEGVLNVPVIDGLLAVRAAGQMEKSDGWIKNINPIGGGNDYTYKSGRIAARLTPNERLTSDLTFSVSDEATGMRAGVPTGFITRTWRQVYYGGAQGNITDPDGVGFYPANRDKVNFNRPQSVGSKYNYLSSRTVYEFDNMSLTGVIGHVSSDLFNHGDVDGSSHDFYYENLVLHRGSTSGELRLQSTGRHRIDWSVGSIVGKDTGATRQFTYEGAESPQHDPVGTETTGLISNSSTKYWALFAQATAHLTDEWSVVAGGRYSNERVYNYAINRTTFGVVSSINDRSASFNDFSPRLTLNYQPRKNLLAYATASRGFKSGGTQSTNNVNLRNEYDPEVLWNYEAGLKLDLFNRRLRFDGAVFYEDWSKVQQVISFQYLDPVSGAIRAVQGIANAAKASSYGAEISADAAITERFRISAQAGYLRAKYDDYPNALVAGTVLDASGMPLVNAPLWTLGAQAQYTMPINAKYSGFVRGEWNYRGKALSSFYALRYNQWPFISPSYQTTNLRVGLESNRLSVTGYVQNLFDENYYQNAYEKAFYSGVQVEPSIRSFGVSIGYKFF